MDLCPTKIEYNMLVQVFLHEQKLHLEQIGVGAF